ncbi:deoxyribose-phosphate aldolase [Myceligenerans crystallogenes]|uniref:Deoxyribose-phosphate aldolase n=1 Tax=Myceligenerans crystallogenes TaxID=316335 RepID=A0ABN2N6X6_9MICO
MTMDRAALAAVVDHTLLKPEATAADVTALVEEGAALGVFSVCVSPTFVAHAREVAAGRLEIATVCGFPSGKHASETKAAEAARSISDGADEVDMVIDVGAAKAGLFDDVRADIAAVRAAVPAGRVLKVIIESGALTDEEIVAACEAAEAAGADFVKTSTGFHPTGGATLEAITLMARTVGGRLGIKASGGIRDWPKATAMIEAGATRLGLSATAAVLDAATPAAPPQSPDTY